MSSAAADQAAAGSRRLFDESGQPRRVVCAAVVFPEGTMLVGPRHYDEVMRRQYQRLNILYDEDEGAKGFLDQWGNFMDRFEALAVAKAQGQLRRKTPPEDRLFSEDLY